MTGYRRDIDGLRALAIMPAVLFHTHFPGFAGGYVGVDLFFVISGFLITRILVGEIDQGQFSLVNFYERRARRIMPALIVMLAVVLAVSCWLFLPGDFESVPRSVLMTLAFVSNYWFNMQTGYFAPGHETMPLLNCWSLAVEEQFYLVMPLFIWLIARWLPRGRIPIMIGVALLSFAWSWWTQNNLGSSNYYLLPSRAWELLVGALLAVIKVPQPQQRPLAEGLVAEVLALSGLGLILFAIFTFDQSTPYPGIATVVPVLGTALLLLFAPGTLAARLLGMRVPVAIGLMSYSIYLWYWPLIVFAEYLRQFHLPEGLLTGWWSPILVAASLIFGWASWRFVEQPFRNPARVPRRRIFQASAAGMAAVALAAAALLPLGGWESRFSPEIVRLAAAMQERSAIGENADCLPQKLADYRNGCRIGAPAQPTSVVWGDSHSVKLAEALGEEQARQGKALELHALASCAPVLESAWSSNADCAGFNRAVFDHLKRTPAIEQVYLAAFWTSDYEGMSGPAAAAYIAQIDATVAKIRSLGKEVTVVGPVPTQLVDVPRHLIVLSRRGKLDQARSTSKAEYALQANWFTANYARWQAEGTTILDPARALVAGERTKIFQNGQPLYIDQDHLSLAGARAVLAADPRR